MNFGDLGRLVANLEVRNVYPVSGQPMIAPGADPDEPAPRHVSLTGEPPVSHLGAIFLNLDARQENWLQQVVWRLEKGNRVGPEALRPQGAADRQSRLRAAPVPGRFANAVNGGSWGAGCLALPLHWGHATLAWGKPGLALHARQHRRGARWRPSSCVLSSRGLRRPSTRFPCRRRPACCAPVSPSKADAGLLHVDHHVVERDVGAPSSKALPGRWPRSERP